MISGLFTDFYELTMAQGYWKNNLNDEVVFEMFFRKQPFNGGYSILAGNEPLIDALEEFSFSEEDINFLRKQKIFEEGFLEYLKGFHFSGDLYTLEEGSVIFPQEPVVRIHAKLIEAQIIEGLVLNLINFQSLIATKTSRLYLASRCGKIMDFGLRRAQGFDGALSASRAAYIGGACGTSNTLAGKMYGIPVMGTMAHSWVMAHSSELEAFREYAFLYSDNSVFLIDTYDTLNSGLKNAIIVGKELLQKGLNFGVRLDSGDAAYLSKEVRKQLDENGLEKAKICVSNELTEEIVQTLVQARAPVDSWGIGSSLITGGTEASFSGVYKLCARFDKQEQLLKPAMKFSDNPEKTTNPGVKMLYRLYDENGMASADVLCSQNEEIEAGKEICYYHPVIDYRQFKFTAAGVEPLLIKKMEGGKRIGQKLTNFETLQKSRSRMEEQLKKFDASYKRILNPHIYKVSLSKEIKDLKLKFIQEYIK